MFAQLGIPTYGIRACAKVRDDHEQLTRTAQELLTINLVTSFIAYIVLGVVLFSVPKFFEDRMLYIIISLNILFSALGMEWLYKALEQYTYITIRSVIFKLISVLGMFFLIHSKEDYTIYGAMTVIAGSASYICNFLNINKYISLKKIGKYDYVRHLKPVFVFFAMACAVSVYIHLDTVMLGFMTNDTEVGYYSAAVKIRGVVLSVVTSAGTVLLPRVSYYIERGLFEKFRLVCKKALYFVTLSAIPMTVYFIIYAADGIYFLSGVEYEGSILPMKIIMPTVVLAGFSNITGIQMLVPLGKEKNVLYSEMTGAVVDLLLNAVLIPIYGAIGAAIGTLIAEVSVLLVQGMSLKKMVSEIAMTIPYWKILLSCISGSIASMLFCSVLQKIFSELILIQFEFGHFIRLAASSTVFFAVYTLCLLILKDSLTWEILATVKGKFKRS